MVVFCLKFLEKRPPLKKYMMLIVVKNEKTLSNIVSDRILAMVSLAVYIISMILPIYVGLSNYATGDDLLYGSILRNAMRNGTSLGEMVRLVVQDVVTEYKTFQGTWSSQILWRLEPSIWGERIYVITIFLSLGILSLGNCVLAAQP